ncbi:hypothetical protein [Ktedonospora formicarum]|uniref:hypothetical protein n=1 Tax=Ktedonospora formicarum TaxID=2778364 RepID=UPI001C68955E|nr:hypothetical protein [Ktedonospora formicarum]
MTPKHQAVIDRTLHAVHERAHLVVQSLHPPGKEEPAQGDAAKHRSQEEQMEALRASTLGCQLRWIAEYVEGYPAAKEPERKQRWTWSEEVVVREACAERCMPCARWCMGRLLEGTRGPTRGSVSTRIWAAFACGAVAVLPRIPASGSACECGERRQGDWDRRQTLHEWMESGRAKWISEAEHDVMWLDREEVDRLWHIKRAESGDDLRAFVMRVSVSAGEGVKRLLRVKPRWRESCRRRAQGAWQGQELVSPVRERMKTWRAEAEEGECERVSLARRCHRLELACSREDLFQGARHCPFLVSSLSCSCTC